MKKLLFLFITIGATLSYSKAQNLNNALGYYFDALRYTNTQFGGSARFQGIAGATTALGGDPSCAFTNPAGLAFMRKPEIIFSLGANITNANSTFIGNQTPASRVNLNINQLGVVWGTDRGSDADIRGTTLAITYTRNNDLNRNWSYSGINDRNNIISSFLANSGGRYTWEEFDRYVSTNDIVDIREMAYATRLILPDLNDPTGNQDQYVTFVPIRPTDQREDITESGAQNQWNLAYSVNYKDKLYIGGGVGIPLLRFQRTKQYTETPQVNSPLNTLQLRERLSQSGIGINANFGFIFRPIDAFRIGASITTPTLYNINDTYDADLAVRYNNYTLITIVNGQERPITLTNTGARTQLLQTQYTMKTPMRINAGAAIFVGKKGFLSADLELVDYSGVTFSNPNVNDLSFDSDNAVIKTIYRNAMNIRLGTEWRLGEWRVRGGYAMYGSALKENVPVAEGQMNFITGGIGKRTEKFYVDISGAYRTSKSSYRPYVLRGAEPTSITDNTRFSINASVGFFF
jgi:hypothetical protein